MSLRLNWARLSPMTNTSSYRTIHLALFIIACIAVHKWRRSRTQNPQTAQMIYVQQPALQQPMMVPIPQNASLPPPPPGMAYLVPIPQQQEQQQYSAVAHQQSPDVMQKATGYKGNEVPVAEMPELNLGSY
jgi:hypothetical protein